MENILIGFEKKNPQHIYIHLLHEIPFFGSFLDCLRIFVTDEVPQADGVAVYFQIFNFADERICLYRIIHFHVIRYATNVNSRYLIIRKLNHTHIDDTYN